MANKKDYSWVTDEMFDDKLIEILGCMTAEELLRIEGIYELVAEELNNEILEALGEEGEVEG